VAGRGTRATDRLARLKIAHTVHRYEHDPRGGGYGLEAAAALGMPPERVFKTLIAEVDERLIVAVVPVAGSLDLKALAGAAGGKKARMADPAAAERATGYVTGGISPIGQRRSLPAVLDATALKLRHHPGQRRAARPGDRDRPRRPDPGRGRRGRHDRQAQVASRKPAPASARPKITWPRRDLAGQGELHDRRRTPQPLARHPRLL
jgi:Cys-tRNA(Pro)/Cys-tRNA(Cys) deacylase